MAEWSIAHAWKTKLASDTETLRSASTLTRSATYPSETITRCPSVNLDVLRGFEPDVSHSYHNRFAHLRRLRRYRSASLYIAVNPRHRSLLGEHRLPESVVERLAQHGGPVRVYKRSAEPLHSVSLSARVPRRQPFRGRSHPQQTDFLGAGVAAADAHPHPVPPVDFTSASSAQQALVPDGAGPPQHVCGTPACAGDVSAVPRFGVCD